MEEVDVAFVHTDFLRFFLKLLLKHVGFLKDLALDELIYVGFPSGGYFFVNF